MLLISEELGMAVCTCWWRPRESEEGGRERERREREGRVNPDTADTSQQHCNVAHLDVFAATEESFVDMPQLNLDLGQRRTHPKFILLP